MSEISGSYNCEKTQEGTNCTSVLKITGELYKKETAYAEYARIFETNIHLNNKSTIQTLMIIKKPLVRVWSRRTIQRNKQETSFTLTEVIMNGLYRCKKIPLSIRYPYNVPRRKDWTLIYQTLMWLDDIIVVTRANKKAPYKTICNTWEKSRSRL